MSKFSRRDEVITPMTRRLYRAAIKEVVRRLFRRRTILFSCDVAVLGTSGHPDPELPVPVVIPRDIRLPGRLGLFNQHADHFAMVLAIGLLVDDGHCRLRTWKRIMAKRAPAPQARPSRWRQITSA